MIPGVQETVSSAMTRNSSMAQWREGGAVLVVVFESLLYREIQGSSSLVGCAASARLSRGHRRFVQTCAHLLSEGGRCPSR